MKLIFTWVVLSVVIMSSFVYSQRPSYAPNPVGYPSLANRFRENENTQTNQNQAPDQTQNQNQNQNPNLENRNTGASTTTIRIPIDARGDSDLVNRISQWPREHQPFWYLNSQIIENARQQPFPRPTNTQDTNLESRFGSGGVNQFAVPPITPPRSSFIGSRNRFN